MATDLTTAERLSALAVVHKIKRWLDQKTLCCTRTAGELGELLGVDKVSMSHVLARLELIGAINRIKRGTTKLIVVTPEGVFQGDINQHAKVINQYKAEMGPLRHPSRYQITALSTKDDDSI